MNLKNLPGAIPPQAKPNDRMTTTKTYQAQLPFRNLRIVKPVPMPRPLMPPELETFKASLDDRNELFTGLIQHLMENGFWWCKDCQRFCERQESDNGQPASCGRCGSNRIRFVEAVIKKVTT